jgi:hypothetical protein
MPRLTLCSDFNQDPSDRSRQEAGDGRPQARGITPPLRGCATDCYAVEKTHNYGWLVARDEAGVMGKARTPVGAQAIARVCRHRGSGVDDRETIELFAAEIMPHFA